MGYLDDVILLPGFIALTIRAIPPDLWAKHRASAQDMWAEGRPTRWIYALPIVFIWVVAALFVSRLVFAS